MASARDEVAAVEERVRFSRAVETVIWGMPAVNFERMYQAMVQQVGGGFGEIVYWSGLPDWKNQTLTPNPNAIYLMPFFELSDGPMVLEIPPADEGSITGSVLDSWQSALEDVGPAGVDRGEGGRYLILPPGHQDPTPDGYIEMPCDTLTGFALLRSILAGSEPADITAAIEYARRVRLYPLARAADPPETTFRDALDVVFDATIPYDHRYFKHLARFVAREPWLTRDKAMIDTLKAIGIQRGAGFEPGDADRRLLDRAAAEAHAWLDAHYERMFTPRFYGSKQWALPLDPAMVQGQSDFFAQPDSYPVDSRGVGYSFFFSAVKHLGAGQFYLVTITDDDGRPLDGGRSYRLSVPADAPVSQYWSATVYDRETHGLIRDQPRCTVASNTHGLAVNPDGSVDIHFGPHAPEHDIDNWISTSAGRRFEVMFRFYGPTQALQEKQWQLSDVALSS